jgi:hypothetical protein
VSKTHLGPQPEAIIFASVVDSKTTSGEIRVSTLKQYGLMQGSSKAYDATPLAKAINSAPEEEIDAFIGESALHPPIFKGLFDTFHGDDVTRAKLRQRAADLKVHPEQTEQCVDIYVSTLVFAKLASLDGDKVVHRSAKSAAPLQPPEEPQDLTEETETRIGEGDSTLDELDSGDPQSLSPRAVFHVNVNLDSSLDTDKLERQLALLKRYGAI